MLIIMFFGVNLTTNSKYKLTFNTHTVLHISSISFTTLTALTAKVTLKQGLLADEYIIAQTNNAQTLVLNHSLDFSPNTLFEFRIEGAEADLVGYYVSEDKGEETAFYLNEEKVNGLKDLLAAKRKDAPKKSAEMFATFKHSKKSKKHK